MPSTLHELKYIVLDSLAAVVWRLLARDPEHGGSYWELRRLGFRELLVALIPFGLYVFGGVWLYLFFPRKLLPWAGPVVAVGVVLASSLVVWTVLASRLVDWRYYHQ